MLNVGAQIRNECEQLLREVAALSDLNPDIDPKLLREHISDRVRRIVNAMLKSVPEADRNKIAGVVLVMLMLSGPENLRFAAASRGAGPFLAKACSQAHAWYAKNARKSFADNCSLETQIARILLFQTDIDELTDEERQIVNNAFSDGYKIQRIASQLDVSFSRVAARLFRFLSRIRQLLT